MIPKIIQGFRLLRLAVAMQKN